MRPAPVHRYTRSRVNSIKIECTPDKVYGKPGVTTGIPQPEFRLFINFLNENGKSGIFRKIVMKISL
jgi:hypothetical protein